MWVFDATPLIYLAKVERIDLLGDLDERCVIPEAVYAEVVETGIEEGYPDARRIERAVEDGVFEVSTVEASDLGERLRENDNFSEADVSVLVCADMNDAVAVMDETYGRDVAATENIETRGTAYLVLLLVKRGVIPAEEGRDVIDGMVEVGWYCAPDVYAKLVRKLDSLGG